MKIAIITTVRNEARILPEWLSWHRAMGVTHFYIFDHCSVDGTPSVLNREMKKGDVWTTRLEGGSRIVQGVPLQLWCLNSLKDVYHTQDWVVSLDADEYIVPLKEPTLGKVLGKVGPNVGSISMNWRMMGEREAGSRHEGCLRITNASVPHFAQNRWVKTLARPSKFAGRYFSVHTAPVQPWHATHDIDFPMGEPKGFTDEIRSSQLRVNHYKWRTAAEWRYRRRFQYETANPNKSATVRQWREWTNRERDHRALELARHHNLLR